VAIFMMETEHALLKAPYETINKVFRNSQRLIEKEISQVVIAASELNKRKDTVSEEEAYKYLDKLVTRLNGLKRKLEDANRDTDILIRKEKMRLDHLHQMSTVDLRQINQDPQRRIHRIRLDRLIVDYLLRNAYYETAIALSKDSNIEELVDLDIFLNAKKVIEGLQHSECKEALKWCTENKSKLKKIGSTLEFMLRMQEFIEMVRESRLEDAIKHARKFLAPLAETNMLEIQAAMATLAFLKDTSCEKYKALFDKERWIRIIEQFKKDNYLVHSLTETPFLMAYLHSGLSSLKSSYCYQDDNRNPNCPVCSPDFRALSKDLPFSHHVNSSLICQITNEVMNEDNPPMVLPNGYTYSKNAMLMMASKNNGLITCPRSKKTYRYDELKRAFIL